jgi:hypothetical protein
MITMTITEAKAGRFTARATWSGVDYEVTARNGPTMKLARALVTAGCPDQPWESRHVADGPPDLTGPSIVAWAEWTTVETHSGPRLVRWSPHPQANAQMPGLLAARDGVTELSATPHAADA